MNVDFQRRMDRWAGALICWLLTWFSRAGKEKTAAETPGKILVILLSEMGSLVLAYPMFRRLKDRYPGCTLCAVVFEKNREVLDILAVMPGENVLTIRDKSFFTFLKDSLRVLTRIRRIKPDVVIDCELFSRVSSIFSFLSGAAIRVGFHPHTQEGLYRGDFINRPVLYNPYNHISKQFLTLVAAIESEKIPVAKQPVTFENLSPPAIALERDLIRQMTEQLQRDFPQIENRRLVLIYPGGGLLPIRAWPLENFSMVSRRLIDHGYAVAVVGLAGDKHLAEKIQAVSNSPMCIDLTGYTQTIKGLMVIFHRASLLITNDGGPGQFAAMTPMPTIIFYGPETPELYGPNDPKASIFFAPLACTPCLTAYNHRLSPCDGDNQCLKRIQPEAVIEKALDILRDR
jgi:ADP-heptose:LPS heptosyltransferase